jgi:SAM-dependent methyltransferase
MNHPEPPSPARIQHLNDLGRLERQVSEAGLARLLALRGDEDVLDLGSGTGFYTDRIAALTTGLVYAVELLPELNDHYRQRGLPANVRLLLGDITVLPVSAHPQVPAGGAAQGPGAFGTTLEPASADLACTIATWHEIQGRLDLPGVAATLRPGGRLVVIDWRKDPESWESGPPEAERFSAVEVAGALAPYFTVISTENLGRFMFAVTGRRK